MTQPVTLPSATAQKQAAVEVFAQYEPPLYEAYLDMMIEWLAAVKAAMFAGGVARLGLVPDPLTVFSQTPKWAALTSRYTADVAREVLAAPYRDLFGDGTVFESRPFVRNWIAQRENRLVQVPNEVYGAVAQIIDSATTNGASIPDVTVQIEELLDTTGTQRWQNRARTVARTETVGAYNGGLHDAFAMIVEADPATRYMHRWLATDDTRTRPDHRDADGQLQPWAHPFDVGGFPMMHPHDPAGPPQEVINCRCVELLEVKGEPTSMKNRQYLSAGGKRKPRPTKGRMADNGPLVQITKAPARNSLAACLNPLHPGPCKGSHHKGFLGKVTRDESVFDKRFGDPDAEFRNGSRVVASEKIDYPAGRKALTGYSQEGRDAVLNAGLRTGKIDPSDPEVKALDSMMRPTTDDIVTYRGIRDPAKIFGSAWNPKGSNEGLEWVDKGYTSTSQNLEPAANHTNGSDIIMHILVPKGSPAIKGPFDARGYDGEPEAEVLLGRGYHFRIVHDIPPVKAGKKVKFGSGLPGWAHNLVVEAVPPAAPGVSASLEASITVAARRAYVAGQPLALVLDSDCVFCLETHKPGLCKGQKRGQTEPGQADQTTTQKAKTAQTAIQGLTQALARAQAIEAQAALSNPKLAQAARRAAADYRKALRPHQQTLRQAAQANRSAARQGQQDTREQDRLDRQKEALGKRAQAILDRRREQAKLAKMSPKQRAAYHRQKAAQAAAQRKAAEDKLLKQAGKK